jgi:Tol biopolymer transport system component
VISNDSYVRDNPQWSPDGMYLAYERQRSPNQLQLMLWSSQSATKNHSRLPAQHTGRFGTGLPTEKEC